MPDARVELYDRCGETLIEQWDRWKGLTPEDHERPYYRLWRRLLERAPYWMHVQSQEANVAEISKRALEMKVMEFLVEDKALNLSEDIAHLEAKQFVSLATSRTGVLVEREQGTLSFIHLTFQEYFEASDLYWRYRQTPNASWQAIQPHLYDSRWLEVILLLLGHLNNSGDTPSIIVGKFLREHDKFDDVIHRDLFLSARCLANHVNVREGLRNEIVDTLLKFAHEQFAQSHWSLRDDAIQVLGTLDGDQRASDGLLALVQSNNVEFWVRQHAAQALGQLGRNDDIVIDSLFALAQDSHEVPEARNAAIQALGVLGRSDDFVIHRLRGLAQDGQLNVGMRCMAAQSLGQLGYQLPAVRFLWGLGHDETLPVRVRYEATQALM